MPLSLGFRPLLPNGPLRVLQQQTALFNLHNRGGSRAFAHCIYAGSLLDVVRVDDAARDESSTSLEAPLLNGLTAAGAVRERRIRICHQFEVRQAHSYLHFNLVSCIT